MKKEPNRFRGTYGAARAAELAGDRMKATNQARHRVNRLLDAMFPHAVIERLVRGDALPHRRRALERDDRAAVRRPAADALRVPRGLDPVAQRLALLGPGQPQHQYGENHGVVGAQQPFEGDEQRDGDEIGAGDVQAL